MLVPCDNPLFELGQVIATSRIANDLSMPEIAELIMRHVTGDFGDLCESDREMNLSAIRNNDDRILSAYQFPSYEKIYVITEWDHSVTTILYADEY